MYFSENLTSDELQTLLKDQYQKRLEKYNFLSNRLNEHPTPPSFGSSGYGDYMVLISATMREHAYLEWLKICLNQINSQTHLDSLMCFYFDSNM